MSLQLPPPTRTHTRIHHLFDDRVAQAPDHPFLYLTQGVMTLGQLAQRYYAGGRVMSTELLRQTYQGLLGPAKALQERHLPDIQNRARTLDAGEVMRMVRG